MSPRSAKKYPPLVPAPGWREKLAAVPEQAWWAAEDEPMIAFEGTGGRILPHHVALEAGVCVPAEGGPHEPA